MDSKFTCRHGHTHLTPDDAGACNKPPQVSTPKAWPGEEPPPLDPARDPALPPSARGWTTPFRVFCVKHDEGFHAVYTNGRPLLDDRCLLCVAEARIAAIQEQLVLANIDACANEAQLAEAQEALRPLAQMPSGSYPGGMTDGERLNYFHDGYHDLLHGIRAVLAKLEGR